jgi:hypothetical protein
MGLPKKERFVTVPSGQQVIGNSSEQLNDQMPSPILSEAHFLDWLVGLIETN